MAMSDIGILATGTSGATKATSGNGQSWELVCGNYRGTKVTGDNRRSKDWRHRGYRRYRRQPGILGFGPNTRLQAPQVATFDLGIRKSNKAYKGYRRRHCAALVLLCRLLPRATRH